jgi:hypothetical protein
VRHSDIARCIQCEVTVSCELFDGLDDVGFLGIDQRLNSFQAGNVGLAGEPVVDGPSHPLDYVAVHYTSNKILLPVTAGNLLLLSV